MNKEKNIYLTFDMDWACDELMDYLYNLLDKYDLYATVNVTNKFASMDKYINDERIELGIHPNFNPMLDGKICKEKETVIKECKELAPEAVVARSHSLTTSSGITNLLHSSGIKYELNYYIPPHEGICIRPWEKGGVLQIPFFYEDDLYLMEECDFKPEFYLDKDIHMLRVFNFHPIHLFLNCENLNRYDGIRNNYKDYEYIKKYINTRDYGIYNFFCELVETAKKEGYQFKKISGIEY